MDQTRERAAVYDCGDVVEIDVAPARRKSIGRKKAWRFTSEAQKWVNARKRVRYVRRMLNLNFSFGAHLFTLTYADEFLPETMEGVENDWKKFVRTVRRRYKAEGAELKYFAVIERGEETGRAHIHVVMSGGMSRKDILAIWRKSHGVWEDGVTRSESMLEDLADYLCKSVSEQERYAHTYMASKNLIKPKEEPEGTQLKKMVDRTFTKQFCDDLLTGAVAPTDLYGVFPGYKVLDFKPSDIKYNVYNHGYIVHMRLMRLDARLPDWARTREDREWIQTFEIAAQMALEERDLRDGESLWNQNERRYGALRQKWENLQEKGRRRK